MNGDALAVIIELIVATAIGTAAGLAFFGGLRLTTQRLPQSTHPVLLVVASIVLRFGSMLGLAWGVADFLGPLALVGFLVGTLAMRTVLIALTRREQEAV